MIDFRDAIPGAVSLLRNNMGLRDGESVLLLSDVPDFEDWTLFTTREINDFVMRSLMVRNIFDGLKETIKENKIDYMAFRAVGQDGMEPPKKVAEKLLNYDIIVAITTFSLSHTIARENANLKGARIASMPGLEPSMLMDGGPIDTDYDEIREQTRRFAGMLTGAKNARITTGLGTDIAFSIMGRKGGADTGIISEKGRWGNLPGGEACVAPVEGTACGRVIVPSGWFADLTEDMELVFKDGYVVSIKNGGEVGKHFKRVFSLNDESLKHRRNCAELGIGTNPSAKNPHNGLEAEKIKGTVHIAVGDSSHLGGVMVSDLHVDFIIPEPTLYLDEEIVLIKGKENDDLFK